MTQAVQIVSCIVDIILILTVIHFIVNDNFSVKRLGIMVAVLTLGFCLFAIALNHFLELGMAMMVTRLVLPLVIFIAFGKGAFINRCRKYLLALLFFSSAEILSIFIEILVVEELFGPAITNTRFLLISIIVNLASIIFIYYFCGRKNMRITFAGSEWAMLLLANSVTFMLLTAVGYSRQIPFMDFIPQEFLQVTIKYSVVFLYLFFVISLVNGKTANHFKEVGQITQENMEQQLEYFKAYRNSQTEINRYKHDMKNHFLYLSALSKENKLEEMKEYINSLSDQWESIPSLNSTGNTVVDSIIYGKSFLFEQNNITLIIEGKFVSELKVDPIDLCTVFANAIDNAIEANMKLPDDGNRKLEIIIKSNQNHYCILFNNPTNGDVKIKDNHVETDKLENNHGFGLKNIEQALLKYDGTFKLNMEEDNTFTLEAIISK